MSRLRAIKNEILDGKPITKTEAMEAYFAPIQELSVAAKEIRAHFCGDIFDLCTIINAKSGGCTENCNFCAQSSHYRTETAEYSLLNIDTIVKRAKQSGGSGILRFSLVTSGKRLSDTEVDYMCSCVRAILENCKISVCASFGLLAEAQFLKLKEAGVTRIHNNLETSCKFFPGVCTTHTYHDKVSTILAARRAGLNVCSGGIIGLGETVEDRIDMALELRQLNICSVPVNILNPIPGTPYAKNRLLTDEEVCRTIAVFRFLLPDAFIRLAGGRGLLADRGRKCFLSGANAAISGDMLTTTGVSTEYDMKMLAELGYKVALSDG